MGNSTYNTDANLGTPALVCRWRIWDRCLPLEQRHLKAFARRRIFGKPLSNNLIAWAKQHIDWTLYEGAAAEPRGTLMLVVDSEGRAAMTIGPYIRPNATKDELLRRAALSLTEAKECGVAPEVLWAKTRDGEILYQLPNTAYAGGLTQLVEDLLKTKGFMPLRKDEIDSADVAEFFLVSDEHGIVVPDKMESELAESLQADYLKLCETRAKEAKEGHRG